MDSGTELGLRDKLAAGGDCCVHFGECGGCASQDIPYADQLLAKEAALKELFAPFWSGPIPVEPSPGQWYYRNRVDLAFAPKFYETAPPKDMERDAVLGFRRKEQWYRPLEVSECRIFSPDLPPLAESMRAWVAEHDLKAYQGRRDRGLLRTLLLREGKRTGERMVVLITRHDGFDRAPFLEAVQRAYPATSIQWAVFESTGDTTGADRIETLFGSPAIEEQLHIPTGAEPRVLRFTLSPLSFFQTNTFATERLYGAIRAWVAEHRPHALYDLYGGPGGIAFSCADVVERVVSVESFAPASADGVANAALNAIANVDFVAQEVEGYLRDQLTLGGWRPGTAAIVDPPRAGLHPKALRRLVDLRPQSVLYVSCKPTVLAREMPTLLEGYHLTNLRAVDLFPHTPHAEVLATLEAKH
ncbi:MAG: 23S rRNA (uracil(1939)-C(5))-methyltransferase RlmD [FCB group bacterium]|jgi:23S rRNA (uracil1939-C5)-methyltransferase|nr:23S rRNA (uracil(1939)-C(5))-methyltransferase RlmD [FCB group bacterium]